MTLTARCPAVPVHHALTSGPSALGLGMTADLGWGD